ncbi:MAG: HDOD domain-containing protein [Gallionella sp.]|jgi:putative nucleotidyltransferase with HDIG domain|nr:HDOD domain-containing protein [Gallionella sp.]
MGNNDQSVNLKLALARLDTLPAMPAIAQKLLGLQLDTDEGESEFLRLIEQDPQISAKIIGLANSPIYGASRKVISLSDAVMLLGMTRVKSVAIGIAATSTLAKVPEGKLKSTEIWMHSMAVAMAMITIARAMPVRNRPQDDLMFFAGLMHDIGYMALSFLDVKASDVLHTQLQHASGRMAPKIEYALLGMTHAEIGAELARHWNLPEEIIAVIRDHHRVGETDVPEVPPLVRLVNVAEKMLGEFGVLHHEQAITELEWSSLGIDPADADDIRARVDEVATQAGQMANAF